jgi:hypothetical protein
MKKILAVAGLAAVALSASALAQPISSRDGTMARAIKEVTENQVKNPQAPGLPRARARLVDNAARHLANEPGPNRVERAERSDRPERVERVERVERPERVERIERVERPERPERVERVDVASRSDFGRSHRPDRPQRNGRK